MPAKTIPDSRPPTLAAHRRQVFWQIWVPMGLFLIMMLFLLVGVILTAAAPTPEITALSHWTDVSMIFLFIPVIVACVFVLGIVSGLVYLLARLLIILPPYTQLAQAYALYASKLVRYWCDQITLPIIKLGGVWAGVQTLFRVLPK